MSTTSKSINELYQELHYNIYRTRMDSTDKTAKEKVDLLSEEIRKETGFSPT